MVEYSTSTHLLLPSQPNSPSHSIVEAQISSLSTTIEKCIGELNWTQFLQVLIVSLAWFFDGQQTFITIFTDSQPSWHCTNNNKSDGYAYACNSTTTTSNICNLPKDSWAWDGPDQATIISEWGLECESSIITGLPASMFFAGNLIGGFLLASLADSSLGRKNTLLLSSILMSVSSFLASFSPNVWIYSALKFLSGFGRATIGTTSIVLASELVAKRWRGKIGAIGFFLYSIGFLSLPAIAYINRSSSWRNLYLLTSIPAILYCILFHLLVHESPRWLLIRGRKEAAVKILKSITSLSSLSQSDLDFAISSTPLEKEVWNIDLYSAFKILMKNKWSSRRLLAIMAMSLGIGLVYYGIPLGLGMLSFNIYLSVAFNALAEIPSTLLAFMIIEKFNRRTMLFFLTIISGISGVLASMENYYTKVKGLQIVFELVSFLCACTACDIAVIYGTELFPTCVRNSAVSLIRQSGGLGGAISPMVVAAVSRNNNKFLCYGVFGLVIMCSGLFGLCLPETKDKPFCDTIHEEESKVIDMKNEYVST